MYTAYLLKITDPTGRVSYATFSEEFPTLGFCDTETIDKISHKSLARAESLPREKHPNLNIDHD